MAWRLSTVLVVAACVPTSQATPGVASPECVDQDRTIRALDEFTETLSGPSGARDWDRLRALLLPTTRFDVIGIDANGRNQYYPQSREEFFTHLAEYLGTQGFVQQVFAHDARCAGRIAHVWSQFESRNEHGGPVIDRGWMSAQLLHDGARWRISHLAWISDTGRAPD